MAIYTFLWGQFKLTWAGSKQNWVSKQKCGPVNFLLISNMAKVNVKYHILLNKTTLCLKKIGSWKNVNESFLMNVHQHFFL